MAEKKTAEKKTEKKSAGKVVKKVTTNGKIEDFEYKASKDDPKYIVETDEGKKAAHKADALEKA